jgi:hypothetical protein
MFGVTLRISQTARSCAPIVRQITSTRGAFCLNAGSSSAASKMLMLSRSEQEHD